MPKLSWGVYTYKFHKGSSSRPLNTPLVFVHDFIHSQKFIAWHALRQTTFFRVFEYTKLNNRFLWTTDALCYQFYIESGDLVEEDCKIIKIKLQGLFSFDGLILHHSQTNEALPETRHANSFRVQWLGC